MKKVFFALIVLISTNIQLSAQLQADTLSNINLEEVIVSATRAGENTPVSYSNIDEAQLKNKMLQTTCQLFYKHFLRLYLLRRVERE